MNARPWIFATAAVIAGVSAYVMMRPEPTVSQDSLDDETEVARAEVPTRRRASARAAERPSQAEVAAHSDPSPELVRKRIRQAIRRRHGATPSRLAGSHDDAAHADDDNDEVPPGNLTRESVQRTIRDEIVPLVRECYGELLHADEESEGTVVMQFEIMGDETVGGIVDEVTLTDESELDQEDFAECVRESMASAVFDPPEGGGVVSVTYPFHFQRGA